ncbi:MAG TPA: TraR/DksA family transcriptional regulator, partial [Polyangiaceae bacterium]
MTDSGLTELQLQELRKALVDKRNSLLQRLSTDSEARTTGGAGESDLMDQAEQARDLDDRALRSVRETGLLDEIDHALSKFKDGSYGLSEDSGEPIG